MQKPRRKADWSDVRERLARATREDVMEPSAEEARRILDERARVLAGSLRSGETNAPSVELIVLEIAGEKYGIETSFVRETVRGAGVTRVPGTPPHIEGIAIVRGEILAVVNLARLFGVPEAGSAEVRQVLLVLGQEHAEFAIACREVSDVLTLPRARVVPPPRAGTQGQRRHIIGVTDEALIVLDGAALLDDERLFVEQAEEIEV